MYFTVYKITNTINDKIYVGVHQTMDLNDGYMGSGLLIKRAITKYGIDAFRKEYLAIFDNPISMFEMESAIVTDEFVDNNQTYNLGLGGSGGSRVFGEHHTHSKSHMIMMSERAKEARQNPEHAKRRNEKISRKHKELYRNGTRVATTKPHDVGWTHSEESKQKMKESKRGTGTGSKNSQHGTCWMCNSTGDVKKIKKCDLESYIQNGWKRGRTFK